MRVLHAILTALDRGTSALATLLNASPEYRIERSALCERCLFFGMVAVLMAFGMLASR